jgi:hypothetical protein
MAGADQHLHERGSSPASRRRLAADARWHRAEAERLAGELAAMSPEHKDAIGPAALRRMHVDHDTNLQLAEELEAYLAGDDQVVDGDQAELF